MYIYTNSCTRGDCGEMYETQRETDVFGNHKEDICSNCSLNCCAWCERSVTLSTISWMAAVLG